MHGQMIMINRLVILIRQIHEDVLKLLKRTSKYYGAFIGENTFYSKEITKYLNAFYTIVTVQPGNELYSQNRENKKSFGATYPPKDFF